MMIDSTKAMYRALLVGSVVIFVDQLTKKLATLSGSVVFNPGISFGFFSADHPFFSFLLIFCIAMVIVVLVQEHWHKHPVSTGLFIGGAISNLLDRISHGAVKDWLPIGPLPLKNNLADWAIFCAVILVLYTVWKEDKAKKPVKTAKTSR